MVCLLQLNAIHAIVTSCEKALKLVSDVITEQYVYLLVYYSYLFTVYLLYLLL